MHFTDVELRIPGRLVENPSTSPHAQPLSANSRNARNERRPRFGELEQPLG